MPCCLVSECVTYFRYVCCFSHHDKTKESSFATFQENETFLAKIFSYHLLLDVNRDSHRKGGNKEAIFYFGDRFCHVNESRALELYSHSLTQLLFLPRFFFRKSNTFFFSFFFGWVGRAPSTTRLRTSSDEFAESVTSLLAKPVPRLLSGENITSFLFHSSAGKRLLFSQKGRQ